MSSPSEESNFVRLMRIAVQGATLGVALLVLTTTFGCYRNVVGVSGSGTDTYEVKEANIGPNDSVWSQPRPVEKEPDRTSGTTLGKLKPLTAKPKPEN